MNCKYEADAKEAANTKKPRARETRGFCELRLNFLEPLPRKSRQQQKA